MGKFSKAFEKTFSSKDRSPSWEANDRSSSELQTITPRENSTRKKISGVDNFLSRDRWDERLQLSTDPHSPYFENFRRLRTPILYSPSGKQPKTILVTSAVPGEGKGFICANLGIALAQDMEHHALMLDCDFRKPALAQLFGQTNDAGVVDHLQDDVDLSLLIRKTGQPKLSVIPSGKPPGNPSELLTSTRMISLIKELVERYDDRIILFDSPPDIVAAETNVLAKHLDGIILVVRHGFSKREYVQKLVEKVGREKILGVVFNACPEDKIDSFLYRNMYYGYGYGGYSQ